jgi:hypothetical protein
MRTSVRVSASVGLLLILSGAALAAERVSLNGEWEVLRSSSESPLELTGEFQPVTIPGVFDPQDRRFAWCRRQFPVPEHWRGRRLFLHFGGVRFTPVVYVNGEEAGRHWGAWEPFALDVTDLCEAGGENELLMRVAADVPAFLEAGVPYKPDWGPVQRVRDKVLVPMGFVFTNYAAVWDDVMLVARADVYVDDVTVVTSVREASITVTVDLRNAATAARQVDVGARVMDGESLALDLGQETVTVPAASAARVTLHRPWPEPKLWQPDAPHLYHLDVHASSGGQDLDSERVRFGFREFWTDGPRFVLNGTPVNFLGTSRPGLPELLSREDVERTYASIREANCRAVRLHANVWPEVWLDVADEIGMLVVEESSYWCCTDQYAVAEPAFWDNFLAHWRAIVRRGRNHPSVVMYSIENELLLCAGPLEPENTRLWDLQKRLAEMGRTVKEMSPTRPIMFDGDDDPKGVADVVNLHYPREPRRHHLWPNDAYWLPGPTVVDNYPRQKWSWDRRKPLYVGEFQFNNARSTGRLFFGDEVYADPALWDVAGATAWRMQIEAFRAQDVPGMCPWTMWQEGFEGPYFEAVERAYEPNAAIVKEYDARFCSGEEVQRTVNLYNDTMHAADLVLQWRLADVAGGEQTVHARAGERTELSVALPMPVAAGPTAAPLRLTVLSGGEPVYEATHDYWVCPRRSPRFGLGPDVCLAVLAGDGVAERFLRSGGLDPLVLTHPSEIANSGADLLVVEAHALDPFAEAKALPVVGGRSGGPIVDFAQAGGRAIILEQGAYPPTLVPATLTGRKATTAFARSKSARDFVGGREGFYRFWRGDNVVCRNAIRRPARGACRVMVDAAGGRGLEDVLLMDMPVGAGRIALCQLAVSEKLGSEPAAAMVLEGLVREAARPGPATKPLAVLGLDAENRADLEATGVVLEDVADGRGTVRPQDHCALLSAGSLSPALERAAELRDYVADGGCVVLHGVPEDEEKRLAELLEGYVALDAAEPGTRPLIAAPDPLTDGLANGDLQWRSGEAPLLTVTTAGEAGVPLEVLLKPAALVKVKNGAGWWVIDQVDWDGRVADSQEPARYLCTLLANLGAEFRRDTGRLSIQASELTAFSGDVSGWGESLVLRTTGSVGATFRCAQEGHYVFAFIGGARRGRGEPDVRLLLDGVELSAEPEQAADRGTLAAARARLTEGEHTVVLEFTRDPEAQEGRGGLWLRSFQVAAE